MGKKYIMYWDFDSPLYAACSFCEDKKILVEHLASGRTKEFKNKTEFWGSKRKEIGGWLADQKGSWKRTDFNIKDLQVRNRVPLSKAKEYLDSKISFMKSQDFCKDLRIAVQGKGNFRKDIYPEYKMNRGKKPLVFKELKKWFIDKYKPIIINGIECDDTISILQNWSYNNFGKDSEYVFIFIDHDLEQNPCWRLNPGDFKKGIYWIDEEYAMRSLYTSILSGDVGDNIPGLEGTIPYLWDKYNLKGKRYSIGPGNAKKLLSDCKTEKDMIQRVQELYKYYYCDLWTEKLQLNFRLLKLLEKKDELCIDFPFKL